MNDKNSAVSGSSTGFTVLRNLDLPSKFISSAFDSEFLSVASRAFAALIEKADRAGDAAWDAFLADLRKHRLLSFSIRRQAVLEPFDIEVPDGAGGTRVHRVGSDKPFDYGFEPHYFYIERDRLADENYSSECSNILAYMLLWRLVQSDGSNSAFFGSSAGRFPYLRFVNATTLGGFLRKHHLGESTVSNFSAYLMKQTIEELTADLEPLRIFDSLGERLARTLDSEMSEVSERIARIASERAEEARLKLGLE